MPPKGPAPPDLPYGRVARAYDSVRPGYPDTIFDTIAEYASFADHPVVVEVGSGTGQATRSMVSRGWLVEVIEPSPELAEMTRSSTTAGQLGVQQARFEEAVLGRGRFDALVAATSWHWVDPRIGFPKAHRILKAGGTIALFWNGHVPGADTSDWVAIRAAYLATVPELADLPRFTPDRPEYDPLGELRSSTLFADLDQHRFPFAVTYTADQFLALVGTYASHAKLTAHQQDALDEALRGAIDGLGGAVTKPYEALLILGRGVR